jgi:hypothetical protein
MSTSAQRCQACGVEVPAEFSFCGGCGAALTPAAGPEGDRRTVTVLFADDAGRARRLVAAGEATETLLRQLKVNRELVPAAYRLRGTYEWLRSRRKRAERWWSRSVAAAEQQGLRFDLAESLIELGTHAGDAGLVAEGRAIHAQLGEALLRWRSDTEGTSLPVPREPRPSVS